MKRILQILLVVILFQGCEEEIPLKLENSNPKLVIEGIITQNPGPYTISLSETIDYYSNEKDNNVTGAQVVISDDEGFSETLQEVEAGKYQTINLQGKVGNTYTLEVQYKNNDYASTATMPTLPIFDSLTYRFLEETPLKDEGYYLYFYGKTPKPEINYYRWLVYKNDTLYNTKPEDFLLASDEFVNEALSDLEFPFAFQKDDTIRLEMFSIDRRMYTYYNELLTILFNDGGLFSPPPVNPTSNVRNLTDSSNPPLGYFQVSPMVYEEVIIEVPPN